MLRNEAKFASDYEMLEELAQLYKNFGDVTRIQILKALSDDKALTVTELTEKLNMTQSAVSHQLTILRNSKLIKATRDGKKMIYELADEHVNTILCIGLDHVNE